MLIHVPASTAQQLLDNPRSMSRFESDQADFDLVKTVGGLTHPWAMAFLPDGKILVTERPGRLLLVEEKGIEEVRGLPEIFAAGQGGLLDIALAPDFEESRILYLTYSIAESGGAGTALFRARLVGKELRRGEQIYRLPLLSSTRHHFGSRLVFAPDGSLYMSIGDRGDRRRAQRLDEAAGATLRLKANGSVPDDNPFVGRSDALPEVFSYGHRNAQGMAVHPETGDIWQHEHGPRGGDEVNIIRAGANYGWPKVTFGEEYRGGEIGIGTDAPQFESPIIHWTPSIAPSGMAFYTGDLFPEWRGDLFAGALAGRHLRRLELDGDRVVDQEILLKNEIGRVRDVRDGPQGRLWILTDEDNGALYRLEP